MTMLLILGASLLVAINAVKKGAAAEGMKVWDYIWQGHDPTSVAVMTEVNLCFIQLQKCLVFLSMCFKLNAFIWPMFLVYINCCHCHYHFFFINFL